MSFLKKNIALWLLFIPALSFAYQELANLHEEEAREISMQLRCPVCRGIPIAESPSQLAQDMMKIIEKQLAAGKSKEEILRYFEERYGEWILLQPKAEGLNLMIWILPALFFLAGAVVLIVSISKWSKTRKAQL